MEYSEINQMITFHNYDLLRALTDANLESFLMDQLNSHEQELNTLDVDHLLSLGITFAATQHQNLDVVVLNWLISNPTTERLEIAAIFLRGLWVNRGSDPSSSFISNINLLLKIHNNLQCNEATEYEFVLTLCELLKSELPQSLQKQISLLLEDIYQKGFHDRQLNRLSKTMIDLVLKHG